MAAKHDSSGRTKAARVTAAKAEHGRAIKRDASKLAERAKARGGKYHHRSKPGEYPHKDSGHLRRNIAMEEDLKEDGKNSTVRVGTNVPYGKELEFRMRRSFVRRTLLEQRSTLNRIITTGKAV
jgi:hypothetical protein